MIHEGLSDFKTRLSQLKSDAYGFSENKITLEDLRKTLKETRNSFKEIEFYVAYHYPEFTKTYLNAAPLFHIEAAGTTSYTLPPEGLQVLMNWCFLMKQKPKRRNKDYCRFSFQQLFKFLFKLTEKRLK